MKPVPETITLYFCLVCGYQRPTIGPAAETPLCNGVWTIDGKPGWHQLAEWEPVVYRR
jgi:hypothetical protein